MIKPSKPGSARSRLQHTFVLLTVDDYILRRNIHADSIHVLRHRDSHVFL